MSNFRVSTHGDAIKWYILEERKFLFFWKTHHKYYDTKEQVLEDIDFLTKVKSGSYE